MTLSRTQKKVLHAVLNGLVAGILTGAQEAFTVGLTTKTAIFAACIGVLVGAVGRAAGALLAVIEHPEAP